MARVVSRLFLLVLFLCAFQSQAAPAAWKDDLEPLPTASWTRERAAHLLERAGFGATPSELNHLAAMTADQAVRYLVRYQSIKQTLPAFDPSDSFDDGLDPFAVSRPAATDLARDKGEARQQIPYALISVSAGTGIVAHHRQLNPQGKRVSKCIFAPRCYGIGGCGAIVNVFAAQIETIFKISGVDAFCDIHAGICWPSFSWLRLRWWLFDSGVLGIHVLCDCQ